MERRGGFPEEGSCELRPKGWGEIPWVGIFVWFMAGFPAPGTVPSIRLAPSSVSLVTYEDAHKQVWDAAPPFPRRAAPFLWEQLCEMRPNRLPSLAQRKNHQWAAIQENRFGSGSRVGGGWGPNSQPVSTGLGLLASRWPEPGLARAPRVGPVSLQLQGPQLPGCGGTTLARKGVFFLLLQLFLQPQPSREPL